MKRLMTTVLMLALVLPLAAGVESAFSPGMLTALKSATLVWQPHSDSPRPQGKAITTTIQDDRMIPLSKLLSEATEMEAGPGCPFYGEAMLSLEIVEGQQITLELAADDCTVYKLGERYFYYLPPGFRGKPERPHNHLLFDLFTWQERARLIDDEMSKVDLLYEDWCTANGSPWEWQLGTWQRFGEIFGPVAKAYIEKRPDAEGSWLFPMMQQKYARPGKGDLSLEEATRIAWDAAKRQLGMSQEEGINRIPYGVFIANDSERPVWKIHLYEWQKIAGTPYFQIDARSGEIQDMGCWPEQIDIVAAFSEGQDQMAKHTHIKP